MPGFSLTNSRSRCGSCRHTSLMTSQWVISVWVRLMDTSDGATEAISPGGPAVLMAVDARPASSRWSRWLQAH